LDCRFRGIMLPDKLSDELEVLRKGSNGTIEPVIDKELRDLLNETKDVIDRYESDLHYFCKLIFFIDPSLPFLHLNLQQRFLDGTKCRPK